MQQAYLIVDVGTGNVRVGLMTAEGRILSVATLDSLFLRDNRFEDGWSFDPMQLWHSICELSREVLQALPEDISLAAVTATSARESIVLIDKSGLPFLGLPNIDNRGLQWKASIPAQDSIYAMTGRWVSPVFSALKLVGLRETDPAQYAHISTITSISDYIGLMMTGVCGYEYSQACETQLLDIHTRAWSNELCSLFGLRRDILPPLQRAGEVLGAVTSEAAAACGLRPGIPFVVGGADTQVAVHGTFAAPGELVLVSGTTSPLVRITDMPVQDEKQRCWVNCHLTSGKYLLESNAGVTGLNYQRFKHMFFPDVSYEEIDTRMAEKTDVKCAASLGTLIFRENRSLYEGGFRLHVPLAADLDRFDFALALANDIAFSISDNYSNQNDILPLEKTIIRGCGGGLQSAYIAQTIATVTNSTLLLQEGYTQASLLGCAALCSGALGIAAEPPKLLRRFTPGNDQGALLRAFADWKTLREHFNPNLAIND